MLKNKENQESFKTSPFGRLPVSRVLETAVRTEGLSARADLLISLLMEGFGSVPIVDSENRLVGIVSEFDLLNAIREGKVLGDLRAGDILTNNPLSVTEDTDMFAVIEIIQNNHLIRVPVVNSSGKLVGIVARRDILRGYLHTQSMST